MNLARSPKIWIGSSNDKPMQGFTLTEVLVVTLIIAVLAALLVPAVSRATKSGRAAVCSSNFHQLAHAMMLYIGENNGRLPGPVTAGQATFYSVNPGGVVRIQGNLLALLQPYLGEPELPKGSDSLRYPLLCPAWKAQRKAEGRSEQGVATQANDTEMGNYSRNETPKAFAAISSPATVKAWWETDQLAGYGRAGGSNVNLISKPAHENFRHCLYMDGHVERLSLEDSD